MNIKQTNKQTHKYDNLVANIHVIFFLKKLRFGFSLFSDHFFLLLLTCEKKYKSEICTKPNQQHVEWIGFCRFCFLDEI